MARERHLTKAPITEALIDLRVSRLGRFENQLAEALRTRLGGDYPEDREQHAFAAKVGMQDGVPIQPETTDLGLRGLIFKSADGRQVVQFRRDGFTFSRLRPYTSWQEILPEAQRLWETYVELCRPESVTRAAVRYINHMRFASAGVDFAEYLVVPPSLPPEGPQYIRSFLTTWLVHEPETGCSARVTQSLESQVDASSLVVLLDIDAFRTDTWEPSSEILLPELGRLRDLKNSIFFSSLTENAVGSFE